MSLRILGIGGASLVASFLISVVLTPIVRRWALERDFVDRPSGSGSHKRHARPTALGGGIAITVAVLVPMVAGMLIASILLKTSPDQLGWLEHLVPGWRAWAGGIVAKIPQGLAVIAGALVMHLLGIVDDYRPLTPSMKFMVQVCVAVMLTAGFGIRSGEALGSGPAIVLTTLWIVTLINSLNFLDNMDGLTAGVAVLTAIVLALSAFGSGQIFVPCLAMLLAGAALGFWVYNFPPASIFMGDAGSMVIGYFLAVCSVLTTFYDPSQFQHRPGVLVPLVVFAIPLYDTASVIVHRLRLGVSIFRGDRRHFSHRLVALGKSTRTAVLTIYLATAATALPAVLLPQLNWPEAILVFGQCLCVVAIIAILEHRDA